MESVSSFRGGIDTYIDLRLDGITLRTARSGDGLAAEDVVGGVKCSGDDDGGGR